jgi:hypothetical protein
MSMTDTSPWYGRKLDRLSRRSRRIVAAVTLLGLPTMYLWSSFWMGTGVPNILWGPISFVLIGFTLVGAFVMYRYVRDRADMPGNQLDERERQLRDRAWILSYQVLAAVVVLAVGVIAVAVLGFERVVTLDASIVGAAALSVGVLLPVLPAAALAWIEPDPLAEE